MAEVHRDFDKAAATWDEDPRRAQLAHAVADAIAARIELSSDMGILDFGCGTGLVTLRLQPFVHSVTAVDSSRGMLDMLEAKVKGLGITNVRTLHRDLEKGDVLDGSYDLVTTSMTLHHATDIPPLLESFYGILRPGGWLAIADLDQEGGTFHEDSTGVFHNGFDRALLEGALTKAGFREVGSTTAASVVKKAAGGGSREFTVFLMTGRKTA